MSSFNDSTIDINEAIKLLRVVSSPKKQSKPLTHWPSLSQQGVLGTKSGQTIQGYT